MSVKIIMLAKSPLIKPGIIPKKETKPPIKNKEKKEQVSIIRLSDNQVSPQLIGAKLSIRSVCNFYCFTDKNILSLILQFTLTNVKECHNLRLVSKQFAQCVAIPMNHVRLKLKVKRIDNNFLERLSLSFPGLGGLYINDMDRYWQRFDSGIRLDLNILSKFKLLRQLWLQDIELSSNAMECISLLVNLEQLSFIKCKYFNKISLKPLTNLVNLRSFYTWGCNYNYSELKLLTQIPSLRELRLAGRDTFSTQNLAATIKSTELQFSTELLDDEHSRYTGLSSNLELSTLLTKERKGMSKIVRKILAKIESLVYRKRVPGLPKNEIVIYRADDHPEIKRRIMNKIGELRAMVEQNNIDYYVIKRQMKSIRLKNEFHEAFQGYNIIYQEEEFKNYKQEIFIKDGNPFYVDIEELVDQVIEGKRNYDAVLRRLSKLELENTFIIHLEKAYAKLEIKKYGTEGGEYNKEEGKYDKEEEDFNDGISEGNYDLMDPDQMCRYMRRNEKHPKYLKNKLGRLIIYGFNFLFLDAANIIMSELQD